MPSSACCLRCRRCSAAPPSPCMSPPRRKWPLSLPLTPLRTGARSVGGGLICAGQPGRWLDDECCAAIDERREGRLLLLGVHHALAHLWLLVRGLLFMPEVPLPRLPVRHLRLKRCSRCLNISPRWGARSALAEYNQGMSPWHTVPARAVWAVVCAQVAVCAPRVDSIMLEHS